MKPRMLFTALSGVLAVLIITGGCATNSIFIQRVYRGYFANVKRLIEEGANVNERSYWRRTALKYASTEGHTEIAQLLIEAGADINARTKKGVTALLIALEMGHTEVAELLKDAGAK